ncbi:MAG: hypothetical protein ACAH21_17370 [Ramlibacter sp.]
MSYSLNDDPTIPPPGRRTGKGADSVVPYLAKSLASKPAPQIDRDDTRPSARAAPRATRREAEADWLDLRL